MYSQTATQLVRAPRGAVYAALIDPAAIETWRVPDDMTSRVEELDPREGGRFRVSLTTATPGGPARPRVARTPTPDTSPGWSPTSRWSR